MNVHGLSVTSNSAIKYQEVAINLTLTRNQIKFEKLLFLTENLLTKTYTVWDIQRFMGITTRFPSFQTQKDKESIDKKHLWNLPKVLLIIKTCSNLSLSLHCVQLAESEQTKAFNFFLLILLIRYRLKPRTRNPRKI